MKYPLKAEDYNMSCQEVADRLGWSLSVVETLQQRAAGVSWFLAQS